MQFCFCHLNNFVIVLPLSVFRNWTELTGFNNCLQENTIGFIFFSKENVKLTIIKLENLVDI